MEGYSVTEAASVLGVPTERVWELLARGVLAGAPEGETGMRVYLQPRPAPTPREEKPPNGNGESREPQRELSPFRELLTEFRNLTERYGQALLALGEARGEVAALRSRVDLLEARMDLRLPSSPSPAPAAAWSSAPMPFPAERTVMPTAPLEPAASAEAAPAEVDEEEEERRGRRRGPRRATESFAEALARAEDPSVPELPGGRDAAAALAAVRADTEPVDLGLPREVPAAEPVPVAEEEALPTVPTADAGGPAAAEAETAADVEAVEPVTAVAAEPEPVESIEPEPVEPIEPEPTEAQPAAEAAVEPVEVELEVEGVEGEAVAAEAEIDEEPEVVAEPAEVAAPAPVPEEPSVVAEPLEWDSERYTTDIEEPDWFAGEAFEVDARTPAEAAEAPEAAPSGAPRGDAAPVADEPEARPEPVEEPEEPRQVEWAPPTAAAEASGADEMEVAGGQRPPAPAARASALPGSHELDEAIAALRALARPAVSPETESASASVGAAEAEATSEAEVNVPEAESAVPPADDESAFDEWPPRSRAFSEPPPPASAPLRPGAGTTGPASRAYRRLRRIFPG